MNFIFLQPSEEQQYSYLSLGLRHRINYFPEAVTVQQPFTKSALSAVSCTSDFSKPLESAVG